jgi:hypothetical protein
VLGPPAADRDPQPGACPAGVSPARGALPRRETSPLEGPLWYQAPAMRAPSRLALLAVLASGTPGCVHGYQDALGYRARQAVLRGDVDAFEALMAEASEDKPRSPLLKPQRTVLTHFLDLAGDPRFFGVIEGWRARGWVDEALTCAIHRARYRHTRDTDLDEAERAAEVCLQRARAAAYTPDRSWEVEACLDEAPFLTETSTAALAPYLEVVLEATEPRALKRALLEGMTKVYLQDVHIRATNAPELPRAGHRAEAEAQMEAAARRFIALVEAVRGSTDTALLAAGTAFGALELERAYLTERRSFLFEYALASGDPERRDLAFAWVRAMKAREKDLRLDSLGLWDRNREPAKDAFWYGCVGAPEVSPAFGSARVALRPVRAKALAEPAAVAARCGGGMGPERVMGPSPMQVSLRGSVTASVAEQWGVSRVRLEVGEVLRF